MSDFGDLANFDPDKLIRLSEEYSARVEEMQRRSAELTGTAQTKDGRIKVTSTTADVVAGLEIDPRAMRMPSKEFTETLRSLIHGALADLHEQLRELMSEVYGEEDNPMNLMENGPAMQQAMREAADVYHRTLNDAMGELDRIARQLGL